MNDILELNDLDREFFRQCGIAVEDAAWPEDSPTVMVFGGDVILDA